jgi:hypothetical protein
VETPRRAASPCSTTNPAGVDKQLDQLAAEKKAKEDRRREELITITVPGGKLN